MQGLRLFRTIEYLSVVILIVRQVIDRYNRSFLRQVPKYLIFGENIVTLMIVTILIEHKSNKVTRFVNLDQYSNSKQLLAILQINCMGFVSNAFLPHSYRPVINIKRFFCISTLWDPNCPLSCQCTAVKRPTDSNKFNRAIYILRLPVAF